MEVSVQVTKEAYELSSGLKKFVLDIQKALADGWHFVKVANDVKVSVYDLWDGTNFVPNPDKDGMMALRKKKQEIGMQIQKCSDDASVNALLKSLDTKYNP